MNTESSTPLSGYDLNEIQIGRVVRFEVSGKYAFISELKAEVPGRAIHMEENKCADIVRYDSVGYYMESGRLTLPGFLSFGDKTTLMDRVLNERERLKFHDILEKEKHLWKPLIHKT